MLDIWPVALAEAVRHDVTIIHVVYRIRIEAEIIWVVDMPGYHPKGGEVGTRQFRVLRGQEGTEAVAHPDGATVEPAP